MAQLLVRNLDDTVKEMLQQQAKRHGRSMEEEAREILRHAVCEERAPKPPLGTHIAQRFKSLGLEEEEEIQEIRGHGPQWVDFES